MRGKIEVKEFILDTDSSINSSVKDRILMEISPSVIITIFSGFRELALREKHCYRKQGVYREIAGSFEKIYHEWEEKRKLKEKRK